MYNHIGYMLIQRKTKRYDIPMAYIMRFLDLCGFSKVPDFRTNWDCYLHTTYIPLFHIYFEDFSFWPGRFRNIIARTFVLSFSLSFSLLLALLSLSLSFSLWDENTNVYSDFESPGDYFFCLVQTI